MSLAKQIEKNRGKETVEKNDWTPPPVWKDPRPDLEEDHHLWGRLLTLSLNLPDEEKGLDLCGILNGLRCGGTRIVRGKSGKFVLRPLIDPEIAWKDREEYEEIRDRFAKPYSTEIAALLKVLTDDVRLGRIWR